VPTDPASSVVADSLRTPDGGTATLDGSSVTATLPDVSGGAQRSVVFDVVVADPFPAQSALSEQG
jgi:hypothetical protein